MDFERELSARLEHKKVTELEERRREAKVDAKKRHELELARVLTQEKKYRDDRLLGDAPEEIFLNNQLNILDQFYDIMLKNKFKGSTTLSWKSVQRSIFSPRKSTRGYAIGVHARFNDDRFAGIRYPSEEITVYLCEDYRVRNGEGKSTLGDTFIPGRVNYVTEYRKDWINGSDAPNATRAVTTATFIDDTLENVLLRIATEKLG